jgi:hypothetical protein
MDADSLFIYNPEWDMQDAATYDLLPLHLFNSIAVVVSLFGFCVWLFFSPHMSKVAQNLDRTCTKLDLFLKAFKHATTLLVPHDVFRSLYKWAVILPFSGWPTSLLLQ